MYGEFGVLKRSWMRERKAGRKVGKAGLLGEVGEEGPTETMKGIGAKVVARREGPLEMMLDLTSEREIRR